MVYKIVQTTEENEELLTVVPATWEKDGYLYWPPGKHAYRLRKNESILPDYTMWTKSVCHVKRDNIPTFKEALIQEKSMSKFDDTADEENFKILQKEERLHPHRKFDCDGDDWNHLMTTRACESTLIMPTVTNDVTKDTNIRVVPVSQSDILPISVPTEAETIPEIVVQSNNSNNELEQIVLVSDDMGVLRLPDHLKNPSSILEEKVDKLIENVENMRKSIAGLHSKFDLLLSTLENNFTDTAISTEAAQASEELKTYIINLLPIKNVAN